MDVSELAVHTRHPTGSPTVLWRTILTIEPERVDGFLFGTFAFGTNGRNLPDVLERSAMSTLSRPVLVV